MKKILPWLVVGFLLLSAGSASAATAPNAQVADAPPQRVALIKRLMVACNPQYAANSAYAVYVDLWSPWVAKFTQQWTVRQICYFLGQCCLETGTWRYATNLTETQQYKGRGMLQLTGQKNYAAFFSAYGMPTNSDPNIVASDPRLAVLSAVWYWTSYRAGDTGRTSAQVVVSSGTARQKVTAISGIIYAGREAYNPTKAGPGLYDRRQTYTANVLKNAGISA